MNGTKKQSLPVFSETIDSVDDKVSEKLEIIGSKLADFTIIKRLTLMELKAKYEHLCGKMFYRTSSEEYPFHLILRDAIYLKIRTEHVYKGRLGGPIFEEIIFGWVVHGGKY